MIYTGIGSRETPPDIIDLMHDIALDFGEQGWTLRSGHAEGADQAFESGAFRAEGPMEIYLPWNGFCGARHDGLNYFLLNNPEAREIAAKFHPAWERCSEGARMLHTRNIHQVVGADLTTRSNFVVCWTKNGKRGGGTGQALRYAEHLQIPIYDLAIPEDHAALCNYFI